MLFDELQIPGHCLMAVGLQQTLEKGVTMSTQAHLEALKSKHKDLETQLSDAIAHASSSDQELAEIKHRKLKIKDEISEIENRLRAGIGI